MGPTGRQKKNKAAILGVTPRREVLIQCTPARPEDYCTSMIRVPYGAAAITTAFRSIQLIAFRQKKNASFLRVRVPSESI